MRGDWKDLTMNLCDEALSLLPSVERGSFGLLGGKLSGGGPGLDFMAPEFSSVTGSCGCVTSRSENTSDRSILFHRSVRESVWEFERDAVSSLSSSLSLLVE